MNKSSNTTWLQKADLHLPGPLLKWAGFLCGRCNAGQELLLLEPKRMGRALLPNCILGACCFHPNGTGSSESTDYATLLYARQPSLYNRAPNSFSMNQGSYTRIPGNWIYICFICNLKMDVCMNIFLVEGVISFIRYLKGPIKTYKVLRVSKTNNCF